MTGLQGYLYPGNLPLTITNESSLLSLSPSGDEAVADIIAVIQATPVYNLIPANWSTFTATGGSAECTGKEFVCQTGTSVGGYGVIRSSRSANYHPGSSILGKFACRFTDAVNLTLQGVGFFNIGDGYLFGYADDTDGTNKFGIIYQHGGKPEVRTITVTGASGGSTDLTLTLNSVAYTIPLTSGTTAHNAYEIAAWLSNSANQTVWSAKQLGSTVVCMALSDGAKSGTYSFSHASATGSIAQTTAGITKTTDFYPKDSWNIEPTFTIDPTTYNLYFVQYHGISSGIVRFYIQDDNGLIRLVHQISFKGDSTVAVNNPSMRIGVFAASLGGTTNMTTAAGCMSAFQIGAPRRIRNPRGYSNTKSVGTTSTNLFTIRCKETYNGEPNQVEFQPIVFTVFTESTKGATFILYTDATVAGEPNFADVATNLITEVDTAGTTVSGGAEILRITIGQGSEVIDLDAMSIRIPPTVRLTVAANVNSGASSDTGASLSWNEDL